ncbi:MULTISPECIES: hypothetical protein [Olsenella]|nr:MULTISPECIES: hypothetical protein [Olsenella]EHF02036.1 hypothetical protein HMPREF1008_00966 [Olsenella sp. oral taxon 809 str. F0356]
MSHKILLHTVVDDEEVMRMAIGATCELLVEGRTLAHVVAATSHYKEGHD